MRATCCRATQDETDLIRAFGLARRGEHDALTAVCATIARRLNAPRLAAALVIAAGTMDAMQSALDRADPPHAAKLGTLH